MTTEVTENRPWGSFTILVDAPHTKVKVLAVNPGQRLSLQSHQFRGEHWVVVAGVATVTVDDNTSEYTYGQHIVIPKGAKHRLANLGTEVVEVIETQVGDNFDESDITRYQDDYARTS